MGISQTKIEPDHPYYPQTAVISGYVDNKWPVNSLLASFSTAESILLITTVWAIRTWKPSVTWPEMVTVLWFVLCKLTANASIGDIC